MSAVALGRLLVRRMEEEGGGPGEPVTVEDVRSRLLPYRLCRSELDLATKAEYDLALLGLLSEPDLVEVRDEELREAVARELASAEPELDVLRGFDSAVVGLGPGLAGGRIGRSSRGRRSARAAGRERPARTARTETVSAADRCRSCGVSLPDGREVRFCPHCGAEQRPSRCEACGEELEPEWRYCPTCGRAVEPGAADR